jgi:amidase
MLRISDEKSLFAFAKGLDPIAHIKPGETVTIATKDCFSDQLQAPEDSFDTLDWDATNPATGPLFIEGARPGDVLKVHIDAIEVAGQMAACTGENEGTCGDLFAGRGMFSMLAPITDGTLRFDDKLTLDLKPMIGVIGVAPEGDPINCGTPGHHGGNMDNTMVGEGATLYLPVATEGALFACGDLHAVMGDGEIGVSGAEVPGTVTLTFDVLTDRTIGDPLLENDETFSTIASAPTMDEAADTAVHTMVALVHGRVDLPLDKLIMLLSLAGDVQVCQMVDPLRTMRFVVPKRVLSAYGFSW